MKTYTDEKVKEMMTLLSSVICELPQDDIMRMRLSHVKMILDWESEAVHMALPQELVTDQIHELVEKAARRRILSV